MCLTQLLFVDSVSAKSLRSKLAALQNSRQKVANGFDLGRLVRVRGNVVTYNGQREIKASQFCESLLVTVLQQQQLQ